MSTPVYADFLSRAAAKLIDLLIAGFFLGVPAYLIAIGSLAVSSPSGSTIADLEARRGIIFALAAWLYFAGFESSLWQATPGKRMLGIRVADLFGDRVSFGKATGRYFAQIISMLIVGIGYLIQPFTEKRQALHDIIAGCLVLRGKPEETSTNAEQAPATRVTASTGNAVAVPQAFTPPRRPPPATATTPITGKASFAVSEGDDRAADSVHVAAAAITPAAITDQEAQAIEDESYAAAWDEVEQGTTDRGTWAKAFAESGGDDAKTRAAYLMLRVQRLAEARREEVIKKKGRERAEALVREKRNRAAAQARADQGRIEEDRKRIEAQAALESSRREFLSGSEPRRLAGASILESRLAQYRAQHQNEPPVSIEGWHGLGGRFETPLLKAAEHCNEEQLIRLLASGADGSEIAQWSAASLEATKRKCPEIAKLLEAAETLTWLKGGSGSPAWLQRAAPIGMTDRGSDSDDAAVRAVEQMLIERRAQDPSPPNSATLNERDRNGQTLLFKAAKSCDIDEITRLLAWGSDPMKSCLGMTPREIAKKRGCVAGAGLLKTAEVLWERKSKRGAETRPS